MANYSIGAGLGLAVMAAVAAVSPASAAEPGEQQYSLPQQPLSKSLRDIGRPYSRVPMIRPTTRRRPQNPARPFGVSVSKQLNSVRRLSSGMSGASCAP